MKDYRINYDNGYYWIGKVVRDELGQAMFIQQVSDYTMYKQTAKRWLKQIEKQLLNK